MFLFRTYLCAKEFTRCQSVCMVRKGWTNSKACILDLETLCKLFKFASAASQMLDPRNPHELAGVLCEVSDQSVTT